MLFELSDPKNVIQKNVIEKMFFINKQKEKKFVEFKWYIKSKFVINLYDLF